MRLASAGERAPRRGARRVLAKLRARWLEAELAIRNEAPIRRERKEGSLRRWRRIRPKDAPFCFGGRPAAPMLALVVRWVRDRAALADSLPAPNRVQAAAAGAVRRDSMGWVVRPCHFLLISAVCVFPGCEVRRVVAPERDYSPYNNIKDIDRRRHPGTDDLGSRQIRSSPGARIATLPQYRSAGHFSAHLMPDRPCVVRGRWSRPSTVLCSPDGAQRNPG
jgi:hypothetical protein